MKNRLFTCLAILATLVSLPIMAQQSQQSTTVSPVAVVPAIDLQAIRLAATEVLENNPYLTAEQKKILKKAKQAEHWTPKELSNFETEIKQLNNTPTGPTGATCTDALVQCEDDCAKSGASDYGSNCLALCQINYTNCLANERKSESIKMTFPTNIGIKTK